MPWVPNRSMLCAQILWYSSFQEVEPNFLPLECGLVLRDVLLMNRNDGLSLPRLLYEKTMASILRTVSLSQTTCSGRIQEPCYMNSPVEGPCAEELKPPSRATSMSFSSPLRWLQLRPIAAVSWQTLSQHQPAKLLLDSWPSEMVICLLFKLLSIWIICYAAEGI